MSWPKGKKRGKKTLGFSGRVHLEVSKQQIHAGNLGKVVSEESKQKGKTTKENWSTSQREQWVQNQRDSHLGKTHSDESKRRNRENHLGRSRSDESIELMHDSFDNRTLEQKEETSREIREGQARTYREQGFLRTSPRQKEVFNLVRRSFPDAMLNLQVEVGGTSKWLYPDVTIPSLGIAIEYDGERYHPDPDIEKIRDDKLQNVGWRVYHVNDDNFEEFVRIIGRVQRER